MTQADLPEHLRLFVLENIDSVELLRILSVMGDAPQREWTVMELTQELRSAGTAVQMRLTHLYQRKVLAIGTAGPDRHRLVLASNEMGETIHELLEYFKIRPDRVIELIYSRPSDSIRAFADAFKIKRERE